MNFKEAKAKLKELAAGEYHSLSFEVTEFAGDGTQKAECACYIAEVGWTAKAPNFEKAIAQMEEMILHHDDPQLIEDMMPEVIEMRETA